MERWKRLKVFGSRCIEGSSEALTMMDEYCIKDVYVLEDVYMHLRPYIQPHPNIGLLEDIVVSRNALAAVLRTLKR